MEAGEASNSDTLIPVADGDGQSDFHTLNSTGNDEPLDQIGVPNLSQKKDIMKALEVVERDSVAIAGSFSSLFSSLRSALAEVTGSSIDHMQCFSDAAGRVQECALDAATKGNRYINSCLRLNEEIRGIDSLATQLKMLRRNVDTLDSAVNKLVRLPLYGSASNYLTGSSQST